MFYHAGNINLGGNNLTGPLVSELGLLTAMSKLSHFVARRVLYSSFFQSPCRRNTQAWAHQQVDWHDSAATL